VLIMTTTPIGVDLAKAQFDVAALQDGKYQSKVFPNTPAGFEPFRQWLDRCERPQVCLEATGSDREALAAFLVDPNIRVSGVNPAQIPAFGPTELNRTQTDKGDARWIARFGQVQQPPCWQPPPPAVRQLQALVSLTGS
jgi:transposase